MTTEPTRRALTRRTAALAAGAVALSPTLAACGGGGGGRNGETRRKGGTNTRKGIAAVVPDHVPSTAVPADIPSVTGAAGVAADPAYRRASFKPFSADGTSAPRLFLTPSAGMFSYLSARLRPAQIEECLRIADYLAAPYGSAEYLMVNFGVEGVDYTKGANGPTPTERGIADVQAQTFPFLATPVSVLSNPDFPQVTKDRCAWNAVAARFAYKPVFWNMNISVPARYATADAGQAVEDTIKDVQHGIKPVSAYQDALSAWKGSGGGDALVAWYQSEVLDKLGTGQ